MKKRILVVFAVLAICVSSLAAAVDASLVVGGQGTFGELQISDNASYTFSVDGEVDLDFGRGHGMLVGVLLSMNEIDLSVGYAYQTDISSSCDFILGAGATVVIKSPAELNYFLTADFDFNVSQNMFVRVGTGVLLNLGALNENYGKDWSITVPLPALAIGWHF